MMKTKRILVIDDDPDICNWFQTLQKNDGDYSVHFEGESLIPDLIFIDDGHLSSERLSEIIRLTFLHSVPVVHMSTREAEVADLWGAYFMRKPLERKAVDMKIKALLKI